MSANVVTLRRGTQKFVIPDEVMNQVRLRMYRYEPQELADYIGKSKSCVYALRSGRTKWPRGETLFALLEACGLELHLFSVEEQRYI